MDSAHRQIDNELTSLRAQVASLREQLKTVEKLATLGALAGGVAHGADPKRVPVEISAVVQEIVGIVQDTYPEVVRIVVGGSDGSALWSTMGDAEQFRELLEIFDYEN